MHRRGIRLITLIALVTVVCAVPSVAGARLAAPAGLDAFAAPDFQENVDLEDLPQAVFLEWQLVQGAGAYEVVSPDRGWSFRCQSVFETLTVGDPRTAVVDGLSLRISFKKGEAAQWQLPLGSVATSSGSVVALFPEGATGVEVRALPNMASSLAEASDPVTASVHWRHQDTRSAIAIQPTPWGVRITRSTTGGSEELSGRLQAAIGGGDFRRVEQYSRRGTIETWSWMSYPLPGMSALVLGADPVVWPRYGYVLDGGFTYGRVRAGSTVFDPRAARVRYRQSFASDIQEIPYDSDRFVRFGASSATREYAPRTAPRLGQVVTGSRIGRGTRSWYSTISDAASVKASVRWTLYKKKSSTAPGTVPATAWAKTTSGTAAYSPQPGSLTRYRVRVPLLTAGAYRLDVTYPGSSAARPDGYSKAFTVR